MVMEQANQLASMGLCLPLAETDVPKTMIERLTPENQLRVIMGLFVVVILGAVLFIVIKAGSHMMKGLSASASRLKSDSLPAEDDWADRPLNEPPHDDVGEPFGEQHVGE